MSNQRYAHIFASITKWSSENNIDKNKINPALFKFIFTPKHQMDDAIRSLQAQDIEGAMYCLESQNRMAFVSDNLSPLIAYGFYEKALFNAYIGTVTNLKYWKLRDLRFMFNLADKDTLYGLGDNFDKEYPLTVYRGICGGGNAYRPRGLSWTTDLEQAKWFATFPQQRYGKKFNNIHVYKTQVSREKIYFCTNGREENEVVCNITPKHKIELVWSE